jgi:hypothetical protein
MKTYIDFIEDKKLDLYGRDTSQLAEAYHEYRMEQYKEHGLVLLPKSLTAENGAKGLLMGEFELMVDDPRMNRKSFFVTIPWTTIKDIYKKVVEHFTEDKWYCRKEVNKGIRCSSQCKTCNQDDPKNKHL